MATISVKKYENKNLQNTIVLFKKKLIKNKYLNLFSREKDGAQLFDPDKIKIIKQASITKAQTDLIIIRK